MTWLAVCVLVPVGAVFAQEEYLEMPAPQTTGNRHRNFWLGFGFDTAMYSELGYAYGGSFSLGYGRRSAVGLKAAWYFNEEKIDTLELNFILRFSLDSGPFIQLMGGPSLYNHSGEFSVPANTGSFNAGLGLGWHLAFANKWFIEPSVRGGYPYVFGVTVSAGIRL
jgi:hypothetical protein